MHKNSRVKSDNDLISVSLASVAYRPLIRYERFARMRNEELGIRNGGAAHKNQKRRGVLIALRAHRHFERSRGSLLQNGHRLM